MSRLVDKCIGTYYNTAMYIQEYSKCSILGREYTLHFEAASISLIIDIMVCSPLQTKRLGHVFLNVAGRGASCHRFLYQGHSTLLFPFFTQLNVWFVCSQFLYTRFGGRYSRHSPVGPRQSLFLTLFLGATKSRLRRTKKTLTGA